MKEEAASKKLPPKMFGGGCMGAAATTAPSNPTKAASDEILSTLLRINNFDSISSIKDDSLDIDLSACVTISTDPAGMISMSGSSLSSTDFWRMLDESAQTQQLEMSSTSVGEGGEDNSNNNNSELRPPIAPTKNNFSGTFLRPEPPTAAVSPFSSPLKKYVVVKALPAAEPHKPPQQRQRAKVSAKPPTLAGLSFSLSALESKKSKVSYAIKEEPPEQLLADAPLPALQASVSKNTATAAATLNATSLDENPLKRAISTPPPPTAPPAHSFSSVFMLTSTPTATTTTTTTKSTTSAPTTIAALESASSPALASSQEQQVVPPELLTPPLYKCLDCDGQTLRGQAEFSIHEAAAHRILHKCGECERDFEQEAGLKKHLKTHRSVEARKDAWKKCPDCGKCLKLGSMWMHRKIHSDNKKYGCDICGQKFVQKINLTHHSRVHTAEKPYECPECQKRFQERSHLQRHQKYHAQTRSYRCEKCGKMYKTERCLKVHNLVHLEQRPFACNVCDKSFISNSKLKQHSNIHTGERPFKCNYCPRDFTNFPNWLKHTRRRHKVDHKTGEHLENIPSYCSKKSAKTPKVVTPPEATALTTTTSSQSLNQASKATTTTATVVYAPEATASASGKAIPVRRKKKIAPPSELSSGPTSAAAVAAEHVLNQSTTSTSVSSSSCTNTASVAVAAGGPLIKTPKVKRERKQLQPKQVQKAPAPQPLIKKELQAPTETPVSNFPDLHCLSITSAEDLIMEQALEMEECGLYDAPASSVDPSDNAISSSEAAAALHFKIKNEFGVVDQEEEYISLNDPKSRVLCSSLESSPFSSPASIDLNSSIANATLPPALTAISSTNATTTTFYMPSFALSSQGTLVTTAASLCSSISSSSNETRQTNSTSTVAAQLQGAMHQSHLAHLPSTQTQALINHLYLPMMPVVGMPLPNQALPSVDTLFSSAHAHASFFHGKGVAQPATVQHNMS